MPAPSLALAVAARVPAWHTGHALLVAAPLLWAFGLAPLCRHHSGRGQRLLALAAFAILLELAGMALLGAGLLRAKFLSRRAGWTAVLIGAGSVAASAAGILPPDWISSPLFASLSVLAGLWLVALGAEFARAAHRNMAMAND